jgi:hypothetical protein
MGRCRSSIAEHLFGNAQPCLGVKMHYRRNPGKRKDGSPYNLKPSDPIDLLRVYSRGPPA